MKVIIECCLRWPIMYAHTIDVLQYNLSGRHNRGSTERTYALSNEFVNLSKEIQQVNDPDLLQYFLMFLLANLQEFAHYIELRDKKKPHDFLMQSIVLNMTKKEYRQISNGIEALIEPVLGKQASKNTTARTESVVVLPRRDHVQ